MALKDKSTMRNALLLAGGSIVGAGLGFLFAPQPGRRTRRDITRFANRVGDGAKRAVDGFADDVCSFADSVGKKASGILRSGKKMTLEAKKSLMTAL